MTDLSKIVMCEFWYDYGRSKYVKKTLDLYRKFHCLHINRRHLHRKYDSGRPLQKEKNMKVISLVEDKLGRKTMEEIFEFREKN